MEAPNLYEQERRSKLQKLRELGIDPYGQRTPGLQPLAAVKSLYKSEMGHDGGPVVAVAGRIMLKRDMGKLSFLTLRDESGDLQVAIDRKRVDDASWNVRGLIDLGDLIVVHGPLGATNKGEITVWAKTAAMAAKALHSPPAKWEGLSDVELRYRQRYVDLWANPEVMRTLKLRMRIVEEIRQFMRTRQYLEVETPMMQPIAGGAAARPFKTHHNALDIPLYLRIAPELYLKRLLVGGFTKVFELNRNFRNEGISPRHNPEFTMLEAYEAFGSWETMADLVETLICTVAANVPGLNVTTQGFGNSEQVMRRAHEIWLSGVPGSAEDHWFRAQREVSLIIEHKNAEGQVVRQINLARPWPRIPMAKLVEKATGWIFDKRPLQELPAVFEKICGEFAKKQNPRNEQGEAIDHNEATLKASANAAGEYLKSLSPAEQLQLVYEKLIESTLTDPCFVTHIPSVIIPLARKNKDDPFFADVYELAINGQEISPGYSELNDPDVQAQNFAHQVGDAAEQQKPDEDFLSALRYGMPPAGGMGMGIDRLVMMLTGAESIRDVILFPLMKPQE